MELRAVCSASAMTASMASCLFGSGDSWCWSEASESPRRWPREGSGDGGAPREVGGLVGKVW